MGEITKAHARRVREGFFDTYCTGAGIDIGRGGHPFLPERARGWDKEDGDATFMVGAEDDTYDFVFSSHCLEHLDDPVTALKNWWRILKPGGFLLLSIPHRDLYEKRKTLPSQWNSDHRTFWLPFSSEPPCTFSLLEVLNEAIGKEHIVCLRVCDAGHTISDPQQHSDGEFSIEAILRK